MKDLGKLIHIRDGGLIHVREDRDHVIDVQGHVIDQDHRVIEGRVHANGGSRIYLSFVGSFCFPLMVCR